MLIHNCDQHVCLHCHKHSDHLFQAISVTIVMFITEPLIGIGAGISGFFRALLSDLPLTLQFSLFILVALVIVVKILCLHLFWCVKLNFLLRALCWFDLVQILVYATVQRVFSRPAQASPSASTGVATTVSDPGSRGRWWFNWGDGEGGPNVPCGLRRCAGDSSHFVQVSSNGQSGRWSFFFLNTWTQSQFTFTLVEYILYWKISIYFFLC